MNDGKVLIYSDAQGENVFNFLYLTSQFNIAAIRDLQRYLRA